MSTLERAITGSMHTAAMLLVRDVRVAVRRKSDAFGAAVFFVGAASVFPLGVGPESQLLGKMGAGVVWVVALLAGMISMPSIFADDGLDGSLESMLLSPTPLPLLVAAKVLAHWAISGLTIIVLAPLLAVQYGLPLAEIVTLELSLLLGTPVISLVGAIGAALTVGVRRPTVLVFLLTLPLVCPVLIFGAGAVAATASGLSSAPYLSLLGALLALALFYGPIAAGAALRVSLD